MKKLFNSVAGLTGATWLCWILAVGSVLSAFLGPARSGAWMARPLMLMLTAVLAALIGFNGVRAAKRRRFDSMLLHLGCACIMAGWLTGQWAARTAAPGHPASGAMAMADGDVSDALWEGAYLTNFVGRVPFSVKLDHFFVERYARNALDREAGRDAPVREYRSRVTITEPGKTPYVRNVRVNHPVRVRGYYIYQMSWGQSTDRLGNPVVYTVLEFIRDPGLWIVYAGFAVTFAGALLFAVRIFRETASGEREASS